MQPVVYILCSNGQYYVGSTTNLELRLQEHNEGKCSSRFTKAHRPFKLVYTEEYDRIEEAFKRERQIYGWSRAKKEALISGDMEKLRLLSKAKIAAPVPELSRRNIQKELDGTGNFVQ